jgi:hypothetical protein
LTEPWRGQVAGHMSIGLLTAPSSGLTSALVGRTTNTRPNWHYVDHINLQTAFPVQSEKVT